MGFDAVAIGGPIGYFIARPANPDFLSIIVGFAAGALISVVTEELIPEAYKKAEWHIGLPAFLLVLLSFIFFKYTIFCSKYGQRKQFRNKRSLYEMIPNI